MFLALREFKHAKLRFFLISLILVLISWLVFILSGLGNGLSSLTASTFEKMDADFVVFEDGAESSMMRSVVSEDLIDELLQLPNVENAAVMGNHTAVVTNEDNGKTDASILGIEPGSFLEPVPIEGQPLNLDDPSGVLVDDSLMDEGLAIGDTLKIEGTEMELEIIGFVKDESLYHSPVIFTPANTWRELHFTAPGSDKGTDNAVNAIMLQGENIVPEEIDQAIPNIETVTKQDAVDGISGYTQQNTTIMMMLVFLCIISAFVIAVFFYVLTLQKTNQFGVLKAIGASNKFLGRTIVAQVFIISSVSIGIGILLTTGTAMVFPEDMPFSLNYQLVVIYAIVLLIVALLSSILSVKKVTKIDPLQAIGRVE